MKKIGFILISAIALTLSCKKQEGEKPEYVIHAASVALSPSALILEPGAVATLTATVRPGNATNKKVAWSIGNSSIATVDENGKVTAKAIGKTTITVTTEDFGWTSSCVVTVSASANAEAYGEGNGQWD